MNDLQNKGHNEKAVRLVEYLLRLASLRTKTIRDIQEYKDEKGQVLWISSIPREKGCFTQAWGRDAAFDPDVWVEIQNENEPDLPSVPDTCEDWVERSSLRNKADLPELRPTITIEVENPHWGEGNNVSPAKQIGQSLEVTSTDWKEGSEESRYLSQTKSLEDHPEVQQAWNRYVEDQWLPWMEEHNRWESVHKLYSELFAIHQEQIRLGEEYELVLGLGLLTWKTPTGQHVCRHLIVANALLEFEARLKKFTVRPMPDGAILRPELDMLDIEECPARSEETAKSALRNANDDPWEKVCIEGVLQALVHSISSQGEYDDTLEKKGVRASDKPVVEYAPALILRKRSGKGLTETLKRIKISVEQGGEIHPEFADLAEIRPKQDADPGNEYHDPGDTSGGFDGEIFFPKPSNKEQRRIVDKLRVASGVLVQGPPGTGKSHTIANLICHLLATGQRTLITAKTPRALRVLEKLIPEELRPLCINLLGNGPNERQSLESSVDGILRKNNAWNEDKAKEECEDLKARLRKLREEKTELDRRLRAIRESETHSQSVAEGTYKGTAARIAEAVNRDRSAYEWFTDIAALDQPCPVSETNLRRVLEELRHFTPEKREELNLLWPGALPSAIKVNSLFEQQEKAGQNEKLCLEKGAEEQIAKALIPESPVCGSCRALLVLQDDSNSSTDSEQFCSKCGTQNRVRAYVSRESVRAAYDALRAVQLKLRQISSKSAPWMINALRDVLVGSPASWRKILHSTRAIIAPIEKRVALTDNANLHFPDDMDIQTLFADACKLKEHLQNDGKLGWGPFRPRVVKDCIRIIKSVRVDGRPCSTLDAVSTLADVLHVRIEFKKAWSFWMGVRAQRTQGPYTLQLHALKALYDSLESVLSIKGLIEKCRETMRRCLVADEPVWSDESQVEKTVASFRLALVFYEKRRAYKKIKDIEALVSSIADGSDAHPIASELLEAIRQRDKDGYAQAMDKVQTLRLERERVQKLDEYLLELAADLPSLVEDLKRNPESACWDERLSMINDAWHWAQARHWIEEYIRKEDLPALAQRAKQIEDEINATIAKLASLRAWSYCFSRLEEGHRRNMKAWQKNVSKITKSGTGKQDYFHRKEAQKNLNNCRSAIPAWVMPLHRIWDTVPPEPGMFDLIIIDEASQCGFEALPLFFMAKRILIVGDDKQISPDAEGVKLNTVTQLINQFLNDFEQKSSFNITRSLFDQGELRYSASQIVLREHFRCMPEIIRFSSDHWYTPPGLTPLRQYGPNRLPPIEHVFVKGGYREGQNNHVVNRPEADAVVEKIIELCKDKRYSEKTMGVIILQGNAQAGLIEGQLLERLGAEEMEKRRLICGNPYSFQGDERDIIFLSMVAASNERIGPLTKAADERRFNVAASRARDQMILFHSVTSDDLSAACLRRKLLEFFENLKPQEIAGIGRDVLERHASQDNRSILSPPSPFDSWFEVDVALALLRKHFVVLPQYEVAGKRIDLVVEGGQARLAVECDGDHWHGADRYEEDMERQRQLERCGWEFFRVSEAAFYSNQEEALAPLWRMLEDRGILPDNATVYENAISGEQNGNGHESDENSDDEVEEDDNEEDVLESSSDSGTPNTQSRRHPEEVSSQEISEAIIRALRKRPNNSCTLHSLTGRVLKEVGVLTRGNPRAKFEKRVRRMVRSLCEKDQIEEYKAKNKRVRLLESSYQESLFPH